MNGGFGALVDADQIGPEVVSESIRLCQRGRDGWHAGSALDGAAPKPDDVGRTLWAFLEVTQGWRSGLADASPVRLVELEAGREARVLAQW